jgi:serine/threonine protein kinase
VQHCTTCSADLIAGTLFCDKCGASQAQVKVARKLRQASFDTIKDAKEGLLSPGERLKGRHTYVIEEAIARSGFGATFRAIRQKDEQQLLIKQMIDQASYDQFKAQLMASFKREAKFLRSIKHPAFPRGYEYFERNKSIYLVMDFINGKELAKAIEEYRKNNKGKIEDGLLVYIGAEIADALEVIHAQGYIYRDLKPQNVMLDGISSRVKMIDFGTLYHSADRDPLIFESEGYTPPEFKSKDNKFLPSGDIYSLGALLYEMAKGDMPTPGVKFTDSSRDPRLCEIITKCLAVDPAQRYQKARHVRDELKKLSRKGFWVFGNRNTIAPVELSVLPRTLYPSACTFCEFCGFADPNSQAGYCKNCRVPMRVGRISFKNGKVEREFFLYSDETIIGSSPQCHFPVGDPKAKDGVSAKHIRIFRRKNGLWLESLERDKDNTLLNHRKILGPVELRDGDLIEIAQTTLKYAVKEAC